MYNRKMKFLHRSTALAVVFFLLSPSWGCTLIGAGVGAAIPRSSGEELPIDIRTAKTGSDVTVTYYRPPDQRGGGYLRLDGVYRGVHDGSAIIERGEKSYYIPLFRIEDTRWRPETSNYAEEGALTGAAIDITILVIAVWTVSHANRSPPIQ